ncbi:MAG: DMT family transporter [Candidatus Marinimicrobia bacterium]|nr:DMT family transporter [Candidatus Neomarinimicrobiota bacterium]
MIQKNNKIALISAGIVLLLWSSVATAFKIALAYLKPFELLFLSALISFIALTLIMLFTGRFPKLKTVTKKNRKRLLLAGILNPVIYYLLLFKAYDMLPAQFAQAVNFTWPLVLAVFAMLLRHEKFHVLRLLMLCISFGGALVVVLGGNAGPEGISIAGVVIAFATTIFWVIYWLITKTVEEDPVISLWIPFTLGAVILSVAAIFFFRPETLSVSAWLSAGYVGLFEMSLTFLLWLNALRKTTSTALVSNFIYAVPFLSLIFIRFVLDEPIRPTTLIGLFMIASGIVGQVFMHTKDKMSSRPK